MAFVFQIECGKHGDIAAVRSLQDILSYHHESFMHISKVRNWWGKVHKLQK